MKSLIVIIVCLLITASFFIIFFNEKCRASRNAIYVDNSFHAPRDGSAEHPYESIQYAIDLADAGDTIYVFGGTYNETLVINKNVTLIGSIDNGDTIISKNARHKYAVEIDTNYVTFESFTISDTSNNNLVALVYVRSNNVVIQGNNITDSKTWGIYFDSSSDNTIGNNIIDNTKGVYLFSSDNNVFSNNNFYNCSETALKLSSSSQTIIYNNIFDNNIYSIYAQSSSGNNISGNTINNIIIDAIKLQGDSSNIVENNHISNCGGNGLKLDSSDSIVIGNKFDNNQIAIMLGASNCQINNNFINNSNIQGIYANSVSEDNIIYLNHFIGNYVNAKNDGNNQWYYETQGNYWDDYNEIDLDLDKIGDTPHYISGGGQDLYPLGYFLKPPTKPDNPFPSDEAEEVGLSITLDVAVSDPDSDMLDVYFYGATDDKLYGVDRMVPSDEVASCSFNLPFETTFLWYAVVTDGKLENRSNIWIFTTRQIPPLNKKPVADPGGPYSSIMDREIAFDGSSSSDPDGNIDFYRWNFGDGSSEILDIYPEHSYSESGTYVVTLTVVDNDGRSNTETTTATISKTSNALPISIPNAPNSSNANELITFGAYESYDPDGTIANYTWDLGDGNVRYGVTAAHKYSKAGTYMVMLTVMDNEGDKDTTYTIVSVNAPPEESPGFEIILAILALIYILIYKKRRE
ncbi:MAG: right-handed parallel beta-helix repeat-containing protein [Thermoplasmatales archaeon]|nr:MAG: right-handed parallel beta-helix repeat-containing protein [Thermoplasmatales archaeon]